MKFIFMFLFLVSCYSKPTSEVERILEIEGCENIQDHGADFWISGCSEDDWYNNQFTCEKDGQRVKGVICSGVFKGYTVRYF